MLAAAQCAARRCTRSVRALCHPSIAASGSVRGMSATAGGRPKGEPRPSASILLVSPTNHVLLLHRVQTSSSFPSAHVFPGGNLAADQDGPVPAASDPDRHRDSRVYRMGAIRECFEESGILLANDASGQLLQLDDAVREEGRRAVHSNKAKFGDWVQAHGGQPDTDGLVPFTRWVTPPVQPKRFTTQMYLYFLPLSLHNGSVPGWNGTQKEQMIPAPTHDGGREHTAARFRPVQEWLADARAGKLILFPPQFFLIYLLAQHFPPGPHDNATLQKQRDAMREFVHTNSPPWTDKCISPHRLMMWDDGRQVLSLEKPGVELEGSGREGDRDHVVLVRFDKQGPSEVEVMKRAAAFDQARRAKRAAQKGVKVDDLEGWTPGTPRDPKL